MALACGFGLRAALGESNKFYQLIKPDALLTFFFKSTNDGIDEKEAPPISRTTRDEMLKTSLDCHRADQQRRSQLGERPYHIARFAPMEVIDVIMGIAPIGDALRARGSIYAYAGRDIFDLGPDLFTQTWFGLVGQWNNFIMPLFFSATEEVTPTSSEDTGKSGAKIQAKAQRLGHILLAVATRVPSTNQIRISILDSRTIALNESEIRRTTFDMIDIARWKGVNDENGNQIEDVNFSFRKPAERRVSSDAITTC